MTTIKRVHYKLAELAVLLDKSEHWVRRRFIKRPDTGVTCGGHYRISRQSLIDFLTEQINDLDAESDRLKKIREKI